MSTGKPVVLSEQIVHITLAVVMHLVMNDIFVSS